MLSQEARGQGEEVRTRRPLGTERSKDISSQCRREASKPRGGSVSAFSASLLLPRVVLLSLASIPLFAVFVPLLEQHWGKE